MKFQKTIKGILISFTCLCSCTTIVKSPAGIIVPIQVYENKVTKKVRIEVVSDNIIRVSATNNEKFPRDSSLITIYDKRKYIPYTFSDKKEEAEIRTNNIIVKVSKKTGEVSFSDINGKPYLQEKKGGGKTFTPIDVDGTKGYSVQQIFESPNDEAFYGLGQHQSEEFNYKGKSESLFQYNTKISVPFIVSNKNYGILWDNYSLTRFGNPNGNENISIFRLYDATEKAGGLTATYYDKNDSSKIFVTRNEKSIDYTDLEKIKDFPQQLDFYRTAIKWEGYIEPTETGIFDFNLYYAGYTKLYLNDRLVVKERWRTAWNPNTYKFSSALKKGEKTKIRLEWIPDGGASYIGLSALKPITVEDREKLSFWSEMGDIIDYYFIAGKNTDDVIKGYRYITGKAPIMPKWAMGYWQSRERYKTQEELVSTIQEYRKRNIPLDNIVLDWFYWREDQWGSHEFDAQRFPSPAKMIQEAHDLNTHVMISVWPKFYSSTAHFKEFDSKGWMYRQAIQDSIKDWVGKGYIGSFYDAYHPEARRLFWKQMEEHLLPLGIDAWWMDASEPDIQSNSSLEYRKKLSTPTHLGSSSKYLNTYSLMNAQAIYEGQRESCPNKRVFLLTRSGFAGLQRYSTASWSGDIAARWEDMRSQLCAGLNFAISGIPYWTMDIGGFCVEDRYVKAKDGSPEMEEWRELNTRWHQFGAFCPLYRSHGQYPYREIYNIAPETHPCYKAMVSANKLRYKILPYIYSLAAKTHFDDYTIMRPLVMDFNGDNNIYNISDQYMFGPSFMICPITEYKIRERKVYLPKQNDWYDFFSGEYYTGGQQIMGNAPLSNIPIFVKAGSIVPIGEDIQHTQESAKKTKLTLYVYKGQDGEFELYEDDGNNYNYENGEYSKIKFSYNDKNNTLLIGKLAGRYNGLSDLRKINIVVVSPSNAIGYKPNNPIMQSVAYDGNEVCVNLK